MRRPVALLLVSLLLLVGCAVDQRCEQVCSDLRMVRPDSEGYLPRGEVFRAAGITEADLSPSLMAVGGGITVLDCGCWLQFTERDRPGRPSRKTIDEILNDPNRKAHVPVTQLEAVVLIDKHSREVCRLETSAARKRRAASENQ